MLRECLASGHSIMGMTSNKAIVLSVDLYRGVAGTKKVGWGKHREN